MTITMPSDDSPPPPSWCLYLALLFAMCTCASAGVVFTKLVDQMGVPPALAASWRLAWVNVIQLLPFLLTMRKVHRNDREKEMVHHWEHEGTALVVENNNNKEMVEEPKLMKKNEDPLLMPRIIRSIPWILLSGGCLGIHFSSWTYSLRETSLAHSLLWVSMGPIIINAGTWIAFLIGYTSLAPSWMETGGTLVGLTGALIMLLDISKGNNSDNTNMNGQDPSLTGDMIALLGAVAVSAYLVVGRHLRAWIPLWVYAFGVVGSAYLTSMFLAFVLGELTEGFSMIGMFQHPYLWYAIYLGAGPGIMGHTLLNYLVKYVSPLTISTAMLSEPLIGSYMGYLAGMQPIPGIYTWLGGIVLMGGLFTILYDENKKEVRQEDR